MSSRKATPDVLGEVLGGSAAPASSQAAAPTPSASKAGRPRKARPAPAPTPAQPTRPVWEYMTVVFRDYRGLRPRRIDDQELADWKTRPTLRDYLNQAGQEGWELVSLFDKRHYEKEGVFKRLKL